MEDLPVHFAPDGEVDADADEEEDLHVLEQMVEDLRVVDEYVGTLEHHA